MTQTREKISEHCSRRDKIKKEEIRRLAREWACARIKRQSASATKARANRKEVILKKFASAFYAGWAQRREEKGREARAQKAREKQARAQEKDARRQNRESGAWRKSISAFGLRAKEFALEIVASPHPEDFFQRMVAALALGVALWAVGAFSHASWIPQGWTDAAEQGFWGGVPDEAPAQMQVIRCLNGVFAQGAPRCDHPGAVVGSAKGWKERAQNARRGIFSPSDDKQTKRDLLATNSQTSGENGLVMFALGTLAIVLGWTVALITVLPWWKNCGWGARKKTGVLFLGFAIAMGGAQIASWAAGRCGAPISDQSKFYGAVGLRAAVFGDEKASAPAFLINDQSLVLDAKDVSFGSTDDKKGVFAGVWNQADLDNFSLDPEKGWAAVEKKASNLNENQKIQARWVFAKSFGAKIDPIKTFFSREIFGLAIEFLVAVGMVGIMLLWVGIARPIVQDLADKAQQIAQDGEAVLRAKKERDILANETGLRSDSQTPPPKRQARRI